MARTYRRKTVKGSQSSALVGQSVKPLPGGPETEWPETAPADLQLRLRDTLSYNAASVEDLWEDIRDWLLLNEIGPRAGIEQPPRAKARQEPGSQKYVKSSDRMSDQTSRRTAKPHANKIPMDVDQSCVRLFAEAVEKRRIVDLENAVLDYAGKFGLSKCARIAMGLAPQQ